MSCLNQLNPTTKKCLTNAINMDNFPRPLPLACAGRYVSTTAQKSLQIAKKGVRYCLKNQLNFIVFLINLGAKHPLRFRDLILKLTTEFFRFFLALII